MPTDADTLRRLIGGRLRAARRSAGYDTVAAFAPVIDVTPQAIGQWEAGKTLPALPLQLRIATALGVAHSELFCLDDVQVPA